MNINKEIQSAFENYQSGNLKEAERICRKILIEQPDNIDVLRLLGAIYYQIKDYTSAKYYFREAIQINHHDAISYYNLGILMHEEGHLEEAISYYVKAIQLNSNIAEINYNLGVAYQEKEEFDEAVSCFQKTLSLNPRYADAYYNLGTIWKQRGLLNEAIAFYDQALFYAPNYALPLWARCMSQLPEIYHNEEQIQACRGKYYNELIKLQNNIPLKSPQDIDIAARSVGSQTPFLLACQGLNNRELQSIYGNIVCKIMGLRYPQFARCTDKPRYVHGEKLRVGIISSFFYWHSVWKIPLRGWVENIDRKRFSLYGYYTGKVREKVTEDAEQYFTNFVQGIYSIEELCQIIRNDNLHVIIYPEIGMDPLIVRLAALKLAPVQCVSLGHPDTSGFPTIDYYLSSDLMEPSDADEHYTERLIRLPNLGFYYIPFEFSTVNINRQTFGLSKDSVLYLCSHSLFTYLPQYDMVFPMIAKKVRNCKFLFICNKSDLITKQFRLRLSQIFNQFGLNADDFVVFLPRLNQEQYYGLNSISDIFLDSIGWSANNSTFEAIACNLPVVTFPGSLMRQRHCAAILTMMQMQETISKSVDEYVEIAVSLGNNIELRKNLADRIKEKKHLIYYDRTCITALEDFLVSVVEEN
ncbi:MAG: tetratricopeptide repeat protein [Nitrospirae bacterium]|nr:tetratricopeptide repeat protein [Nitrospirota bacterium]